MTHQLIPQRANLEKKVRSTCCYCGVGCGVILSKDKNGQVFTEGDKDHPVNRGQLCSKGINLHHTLNDRSDRLLFPEMRYNRSAPRLRVTWDQAIERTAAVFNTLIEKFGKDSIAIYASGQCLTEEYYLLNKLMKGFIGSNNIDTNSRLCMSSAVAAYKMSLGEDTVPVSYDDIESADAIFVAGGNPAWCHPIIWRRVEAAKEKNPALKIIVSDPRKTQTASGADLFLQVNPGTDITLHHAIGRCLVSEGYADIDFVQKHTTGFKEYCKKVFERSVEDAAIICGVSESQIREAAEIIGKAKGFISMWTMGLNQSVIGVNKNLSLINLNLITGQIGKKGAGPLSLTGQPNAMGGREVGALSNLLPAHRDLSDISHRQEVEKYWNVSEGTISSQPGLTAGEIFEALDNGKLKAIWIICTNPLVSLPDSHAAERALSTAKFVVVQDISNKNQAIPYADVVLPAAAWGEKEGTMTNAERRITRLEKITEAPGECIPDVDIISRLARKMGFKGFDFADTEEIFLEHCKLTKNTSIDYSEVDYQVLNKYRSVQWPYAGKNAHEGNKQIFADKIFFTHNGKATIYAVSDTNLSPIITPQFPFILTTGRMRDQWHTMTKTGKVNRLKTYQSSPFVEIHPDDARAGGINENDIVKLSSVNGEVIVKAKITFDIKQGVLFIPMHWGKIGNHNSARSNNLTNNITDPISKEPDFKFTPARIERHFPKKKKIIVVGAGAGAFGFVKSYRELNTDDEIELFSKENLPFYNRVLLPDYINNTLGWDRLVKMTPGEESDYNIRFNKGCSIERINRAEKTVTDSLGKSHSYDVLILATGSRAAVPGNIPSMEGVFTMRCRDDADRFKKHICNEKNNIAIIGGGLLGIELAAALNETGIAVTIIQRISRLMDRQLDPLGSQLLHEELTDKGIEIYYNDEVDRIFGDQVLTGIRLKSGLEITCSAMVVAIGTSPNIELAKDAGLACKRGVVVDDYLTTSDNSIFAIGEIAEHNGFLYGITAAAEQQASVVASFLNDDVSSPYDGSLLMNILKVHGTAVCSMGLAESPDDPQYEEIIFLDKAKRYYKKCIVYNDRMVGAILIGDKSEFLEFRDLIEKKTELSEKRLQLLRSGTKAEPLSGKLVCSCANVGDGNIRKKISQGCSDLVQLCQLSGAGMGCGSCRPEIKTILHEAINYGKQKLVLI